MHVGVVLCCTASSSSICKYLTAVESSMGRRTFSGGSNLFISRLIFDFPSDGQVIIQPVNCTKVDKKMLHMFIHLNWEERAGVLPSFPSLREAGR